MTMQLKQIDIDAIKEIALDAGFAIMQIYSQDFEVEYKDDKSPLTKADLKSNQIICESLHSLYPKIPIMSEENQQTDYDIRKNWEYYWCIDPIDGTKEFIKKNNEFTVNIALIYKNTPVLGVVYAPALGEMYFSKQDEGAYFQSINSHNLQVGIKKRLPLSINNTKEKLRVVASRSHLSSETQEFINSLGSNIEQVFKGSSLKLCMVAIGTADIYPKLGPTMEWDTAAGDAIVRESGKMTYNYETKKPIVYNKENLLNPWFVVK